VKVVSGLVELAVGIWAEDSDHRYIRKIYGMIFPTEAKYSCQECNTEEEK